ncbi:hypothetical protein SJI00_19525 [Pseudomonas sp. RP23018S]|uniref:hypothetical protein n=1 Tax=Pseudomonas sp. RP23018S TaxID=3096037 RepID=UPI002ACA081F|nr:hypothetical protein [Pseudomonas sp. RP23018S]MDZ5604963.1 hypothetical protein [Pseudomonas sp. RP23018S]
MKNPVPDPAKALDFRTLCSINSNVRSGDILAHTLQIMAGIGTTLDEYICANAGEPGVRMLVNSVHHLQMTQALTEAVLQRVERERRG